MGKHSMIEKSEGIPEDFGGKLGKIWEKREGGIWKNLTGIRGNLG